MNLCQKILWYFTQGQGIRHPLFAPFPFALTPPTKELALIRVYPPPVLPGIPPHNLGNGGILNYLKLFAKHHISIQKFQWFLRPMANKVKTCRFSYPNTIITLPWSNWHSWPIVPDTPLPSCQNGLSTLPHKDRYHLWPFAFAYSVFSALRSLLPIPYLPIF